MAGFLSCIYGLPEFVFQSLKSIVLDFFCLLLVHFSCFCLTNLYRINIVYTASKLSARSERSTAGEIHPAFEGPSDLTLEVRQSGRVGNGLVYRLLQGDLAAQWVNELTNCRPPFSRLPSGPGRNPCIWCSGGKLSGRAGRPARPTGQNSFYHLSPGGRGGFYGRGARQADRAARRLYGHTRARGYQCIHRCTYGFSGFDAHDFAGR